MGIIALFCRGFDMFNQYYDNKLINVFYSTPSCYVKAVNEEANSNDLPFPLKTDDFFPYANDPHAYWSGYFTSRPTSKRYERQGNNILQVNSVFRVTNRTCFYGKKSLGNKTIGYFRRAKWRQHIRIEKSSRNDGYYAASRCYYRNGETTRRWWLSSNSNRFDRKKYRES